MMLTCTYGHVFLKLTISCYWLNTQYSSAIFPKSLDKEIQPEKREIQRLPIFRQSLSYNIYKIYKYFFYYMYTLITSRWQNRVHSDDRLCDRPITNERRKDRNNSASLRSGEAKVNSEKAKQLFYINLPVCSSAIFALTQFDKRNGVLY